MTYSFSNTPVYVSEGQTVRFKFKAPSQWNTTQSVTIQIGEQQTIWYITTIPEDYAPDPFPFTILDEADTDVLYVYGDGSRPGEDIVTISGLTPSTEASVSVTGSLPAANENFSIRVKRVSLGETEFGEWTIPGGGIIFLQNTDELQVRLRSSVSPGLGTYVDITVGARTERWIINTAVTPPNIPEPFPDFNDITNAPFNTAVYSNILQIQGLNDTAIITSGNSNLYVGISDTNNFFTNSDGYNVLSGVTFELVSTVPAPTITNGQYLQLYVITENAAGAITSSVLGIGDESSGSNWLVTTGNFPSTNPNSFSFVNKTGVLEDSLIASDPAPLPNGILGLGNNVEVDVELISTTGTEPRIKIQYAEGGESSVGLFPTKVNNGDKIVLYNRSSATFGDSVQTIIKVGQRQISPWSIITNLGPDTDADYQAPANLTNQAPNTEVSSSIVTVTGINRPITIDATNGALISIDFGLPTSGPVTFDPEENESFRVFITTSPNLSGVVDTTVTVGTGTPNQFIWQVSNYAIAPPPPDLKGAWYSKKNAFVDSNGDIRESKDDGFAIGTVIPVLKRPDGTYGTLDGELSSRFPGYLECDGSKHPAADYPDLYEVIKDTYAIAGDAVVVYDEDTKTYSGEFRLPDYRNRKLVGTGVVDGNRASSAFVPSDGSVYDAGGIGGWWYVDNVDVADDTPYEQILGDRGGSTGTSSNFFSIGTVKTVFNAPITADVEFDITGSVTATVGPLLDTLVSVPLHSHLYVAGICDGTSGDPLIEWGARALMAAGIDPVNAPNYGQGLGSSRLFSQEKYADGQTDFAEVAEEWVKRAGDFATEWNSTDGVDDLASLVETMMRRINLEQYENPTGSGAPNSLANEFGDANMRVSTEIKAETWWPSPYSNLDDEFLVPISTYLGDGEYPIDPGQGTRRVSGVIDTIQTFKRIDSYSPPILSGSDSPVTQGHSHYITLQPVIDLTTDYSYGNSSGAGEGRVGLGSAGNSINVVFNQSQVGMELNTGTFTLNTSIKKPIPDVVFSPNRKVPLVPEFHKVKYIIKAY